MEVSTPTEPIEEPAGSGGLEPTAETAAADQQSPFGPHSAPADRWLKLATWALVIAVVLVSGYLAVSYFSDLRLRDTQSPAARAIANLEAMVAKSPSVALGHVRLAEALMANGQQSDAIVQLNTALKLEKDNVAALTDLGLIAMQRRDWVQSEANWKKLITLLSSAEMANEDQRLADVYYYLGTTYVELSRYEDAVANLKESIKIKRDSSPVHYMLSVAYQRLGLTELQQEELTVVLAFDPTQAQANYDMGMLMLKQGDIASAAELFRIAADGAPAGITDPQKQLDLLGKASDRFAQAVANKTKNPKQALSDARIAAALDPSDVAAVRLVAELWEVNKDPKRAQNAWERVLELVPGDVQATDAIKRLTTNAK
jgi:tetratricopeptide (TPR) repeat protein